MAPYRENAANDFCNNLIYNCRGGYVAKAGCWPRDRTTKRTVHEVKTSTGAWGRNAPLEPIDEWFLKGLNPTEPHKDTDGDGLPDAWERSHNLDCNNSDDATRIVAAGESRNDRHLGYSYIEFFINELADHLVPKHWDDELSD